MLPLGKNADAGEYITVNGVLGHATSAIVGGTDAIVEDTNWVQEDNEGTLNTLKKTLVVLTGTTASSTGITRVDYPSGFTKDNTQILSCAF